MSKKRKREVDLELVKVYEDLANEQENVRLGAAHTLLSKIFKPGVTSEEQTKTILTRLFRGLCSSRKAARLGFSVALTELLSQLPLVQEGGEEDTLSISTVVDICEAQTLPEGGTSSQDERDHYYGRVFGADALLKSGILFKDPAHVQFTLLLGLICVVANKKPWLRQQCGWILYVCISTADNNLSEPFAIEIIQQLTVNKLIRTPEGLAIWLATARRFPHAKLPKSVWKNGDPLAQKDANFLADLLRDARTHSDQTDAELEAQGSARWSASLHFAWDVVLAEIFREASERSANGQNGAKATNKRISFEVFWTTIVDESLFSTSSSTERKTWGFSLWRKVFETAPREMLPDTFTPQAMYWLVSSLKSSERFLQKSALRVAQILPTRFSAEDAAAPTQGLTGACVRALLRSVSYGDFDQITKTKTMRSLLEVDDPAVLQAIHLTLTSLLKAPAEGEDQAAALTRQKSIINLETKVLAARIPQVEQKGATNNDFGFEEKDLILDILELFVRELCISRTEELPKQSLHLVPVLLSEAQGLVKERLALSFEQVLKLGPVGCRIFQNVALEIRSLEQQKVPMAVVFEDEIQEMVEQAFTTLARLRTTFGKSASDNKTKSKSAKGSLPEQFPSFNDGLSLLFSLVLIQIYSGDSEAVQILQELLENHANFGEKEKRKSTSPDQLDSTDSIIEILLSLVSTPSKFMRRITAQVFEAFAPYITSNGLESLSRVLATKENVQGQQEMFQAEDVEMNDDVDSSFDPEGEELDSDVEVESVPDGDGPLSDAEDSDDASEDSDEGSDDEEEDEELAAFDAALASALGTRRLDQNDIADGADASDSSSDADMGDDEMMELDSKLAEVFRARKEQESKNKKKEAKDAKENVVNFKRRVLDLMDVYLKHQHPNPLAVDLILPLLTLARTTQTKQLAERSLEILQQFCSRCKGYNVPDLKTDTQRQHAVDVLKSIHQEAAKESSKAHSSLASLSSILVVKSLVKASSDNVKTVVEIYGSTRVQQLTGKKCHILPGFFTDWNNWCQTARENLAR